MLQVTATYGDICAGDVFETCCGAKGWLKARSAPYMEQSPLGGHDWWIDTEPFEGVVGASGQPETYQRVMIAGTGGSVIIRAASAESLAPRVVEALAKFDTAVVRAVLAAFCPICGERECHRHR